MTCRVMQRAAVLVSILGAAAPALADTIEVGVDGITFVPADIKINVGDTVHWSWNTDPMPHNVVSGDPGVADGNFTSGPLNPTGNYSLLFDEAFLLAHPKPDNVYAYYCEAHWAANMVGSITVNKPIPTVSQWGLIFMGVLAVAAATFVIRRRRAPAA